MQSPNEPVQHEHDHHDNLEERLDTNTAISFTSLYLSTGQYVTPSYHPASEHHDHTRHETDPSTTALYTGIKKRKPVYATNEKAAKDGPFKPDAPMVFIAPLIDTTILQPHQMGSLNIRGYCTPGYNDDKAARIRSNDPDPQRVYWHEYFHFAKIHGGDGSEEYVHMLEHWRLGDE